LPVSEDSFHIILLILIRRIHMRKYLPHILIISFVFLLAPTAQIASHAGELEDAKEKVRNNPDDADAHIGLGVTYGDAANWNEAIASFKQAIKLDPDNDAMGALAHFGLCSAYFNLGMYKEAIESGKQAIRIDPDYRGAHAGLGIAYGSLGMHKESIEPFKQAIRIDPDNVAAHTALGIAYYSLGDKSSALEQYKILKKLDAEMADLLFNLIYK
jgi:tetratricopeptide (TPR) repeat protein